MVSFDVGTENDLCVLKSILADVYRKGSSAQAYPDVSIISANNRSMGINFFERVSTFFKRGSIIFDINPRLSTVTRTVINENHYKSWRFQSWTTITIITSHAWTGYQNGAKNVRNSDAGHIPVIQTIEFNEIR